MSDLGRLDIAGMTQDDAEQIVAWRYEPPYDFYDLSSDAGDPPRSSMHLDARAVTSQ